MTIKIAFSSNLQPNGLSHEKIKSLHQLVRSIPLWQLTTVITRSHYLTIGACRTQCYQISALHLIQVYRFSENIRRFTDRPYHIIRLNRILGSNILYLMVSLIQRRTNQIRHTGIKDGKFLIGSLFYIKHLRDK